MSTNITISPRTMREIKNAIRYTQYDIMTGKEQFETFGKGLLVRAPAKINLSLLIAGKRADGFHEIETIMAKVDLFDEILIQPGLKGGIELLCEGPHWAPAGKENLVYKAATSLLDSCGRQDNIKITLTKNIPAGSGLGSASSNAAATLIGLAQYLKLDLEQKTLAELAADLGSDVAFFLNGPLARCTGKGEKIEKLHEIFNFMALLILPDVNVSTKRVYANYEHDQSLYESLNTRINSYISKNRIDLVVKMCANMLGKSCFGLANRLAELKAKIESLGIGPLCLSGSGSAMFCIIDNRDKQTVRGKMRNLEENINCECVIVSNNRW